MDDNLKVEDIYNPMSRERQFGSGNSGNSGRSAHNSFATISLCSTPRKDSLDYDQTYQYHSDNSSLDSEKEGTETIKPDLEGVFTLKRKRRKERGKGKGKSKCCLRSWSSLFRTESPNKNIT